LEPQLQRLKHIWWYFPALSSNKIYANSTPHFEQEPEELTINRLLEFIEYIRSLPTKVNRIVIVGHGMAWKKLLEQLGDKYYTQFMHNTEVYPINV